MPRRFPRQAPSFQRRLESSVRNSGAHTGRRDGRVVSVGSRARPRHSSEGWNPACATAERTRGGGAEGLCPSVPAPGPVIPAKAGIQRAQQRSAHGPKGRRGVSVVPVNPPSFQRRLESSVRDSGAHTGRRSGRVVSDVPRARPRHSSEGWNPACATAERTRGGGVEGLCPRFLSPQKPHIPRFCRPNQRQLHIAPSPRQSLHWSPSFPCRREPRTPCPMSGCRGGSRTARTSRHLNVPPNQRQLPIAPSTHQPLHWSHTPFPRIPPSFQRRLESSVRDSGAHTGRRGGRVVSEVPVPCRSPRPLGEG